MAEKDLHRWEQWQKVTARMIVSNAVRPASVHLRSGGQAQPEERITRQQESVMSPWQNPRIVAETGCIQSMGKIAAEGTHQGTRAGANSYRCTSHRTDHPSPPLPDRTHRSRGAVPVWYGRKKKRRQRLGNYASQF